jgi:hypothetical protein
MKLEFFRQIFERQSNIYCHENPSSWSRVICGDKDGRTDNRHDKANSRFSQFCESDYKLNILPREWIYVFRIDLKTNCDYFRTPDWFS